MDPLGTLPFLVSFLAPFDRPTKGKVVRLAMATGMAVGLVFLALGRLIFSALGITVDDFLVAGGAVLAVLSLRELVTEQSKAPPQPDEMLAVVPIGTPLLVGPATVSMLILQVSLFEWWAVLAAFGANLLLAWAIFSQAGLVARILGKGGLMAFSKIAALLMAAIAVQLVRRGLQGMSG